MNYFNYFTEIEQRFQQRRGSLLMLSTLDWALIETWRDSGIPLEAVLRGIDLAFDRHDAKKHTARTRKINGLAWCSQAVLEATEQAQEAATGIAKPAAVEAAESGFEPDRITAYLIANAEKLKSAPIPEPARAIAGEITARLLDLAQTPPPNLEQLDRTLTVLEEKLFQSLLLHTPEQDLVRLREQSDRELAPYRAKMQAIQIKQVQQQILQKRLFELYAIPRLSLFYMGHA
jgi:hypothetical protein